MLSVAQLEATSFICGSLLPLNKPSFVHAEKSALLDSARHYDEKFGSGQFPRSLWVAVDSPAGYEIFPARVELVMQMRASCARPLLWASVGCCTTSLIKSNPLNRSPDNGSIRLKVQDLAGPIFTIG